MLSNAKLVVTDTDGTQCMFLAMVVARMVAVIMTSVIIMIVARMVVCMIMTGMIVPVVISVTTGN